MQDRQIRENQGMPSRWNLFASVLQDILAAHGARLSQLDDSVGIHREKVRRLRVSLEKPGRFITLNPDELERVIQRYTLTAEEQQRLQAAILATSVEEVLIDRQGDPQIALATAEQIMYLIEKNLHGNTLDTEGAFSTFTRQALQKRAEGKEESTLSLAVALAEKSLTNKLDEREIVAEVERSLSENASKGIPAQTNLGERPTLLGIRILQEPLTAQNVTTVLTALTELSTKYWLIAKGRFADLIEYTQTHNGRFAEEAQIVITRISYNSPFNMNWKVDISASGVAEALVTTIDGITQRQERLEEAKLENQAKALEIQEAEQKIEQENQKALLEQEQQRLELEQRRLEVLEKQLEVQKKGIEYALEIAGKVVDTLHPGADPATRAMEIQALLPNLVQLQNGKALELALPPPLPGTK